MAWFRTVRMAQRLGRFLRKRRVGMRPARRSEPYRGVGPAGAVEKAYFEEFVDVPVFDLGFRAELFEFLLQRLWFGRPINAAGDLGKSEFEQ